eukprot:TRINITY_DN6031_c0_g3_i1.p1 TRINITY_DN6031_c0_g3~~TRINITY_DN6031_c0_g3_i1.p1  ORF type:complete len:275 (-),score=63.98 TRINITY_DN6031_c0_g3_i1:226-957(-)
MADDWYITYQYSSSDCGTFQAQTMDRKYCNSNGNGYSYLYSCYQQGNVVVQQQAQCSNNPTCCANPGCSVKCNNPYNTSVQTNTCSAHYSGQNVYYLNYGCSAGPNIPTQENVAYVATYSGNTCTGTPVSYQAALVATCIPVGGNPPYLMVNISNGIAYRYSCYDSACNNCNLIGKQSADGSCSNTTGTQATQAFFNAPYVPRLTGGGVAGIIIGIVFGTALLGGAGLFLYRLLVSRIEYSPL